MAFLKTEAVVIKTFNLRETDKIITFFSADFGKIQGIAKGIRKIKSRYSGKLELFTRVRVIFFRKTAVGGFSGTHPLLRITQVDAIEAFPQLHADFNKIIGASYVAEFLNKVFEEYDNTHQAVYTLVCDTLRVLAASDQLRNILPAFEIRLLAELGYAPILDHCTVCGKTLGRQAAELPTSPPGPLSEGRRGNTEFMGFSSAAGGIVCQACKLLKKDSLAISPEAVVILRQLLAADLNAVPAIALPTEKYREIKNLLANHFHYHLGLSLKTEAFVQKLRAAHVTEEVR